MSAKIDKALKMYLHFLHSKDKKDLSCLNCKSVLIEEKQSEDYFKVDFSSSQNYAHTKPVSCRYKGRNIPCSGWNSVFINITRAIYQDCHTKFPVGHSLSSSSRIDIGSPEGMVYPKEIANGIYLECNVSASGVVSKLRALMVICGMNYSDVVIEYRQNVKQSKVQKKTETAVIPSTQLQWMPHFTKELTELIAKYYKYGFRVGSPIELMRLRNYAESANVELPVSDEELEREVSVVGVLIDGKIYALSDEILEEVASITDIIFEQGVGVIFIELFMEKNSEWLEEHYIVTVDMLKEILKKARPQYYLGQNIITVAEKISEHDAIVKEILRVSKGSSVVIFSELVEVLEYIPSEKIAWSLSMSPEFVWISEGKYFCMKDFIISEEDENAISMYVDRECGLNGYVSITNLPYGNIPEENYELSDSALQTAVYNKVLKKNYYLHGKILTKESNGVDIDILLKAYCSGKDICTASEVMERAIELTGKNQLYKLWSDRTGGTKSPKQWSEKYKTPILCCVDSEIYGEAKKAFSVLNSSFQSESDIKAALEFCEKATFFDKLSDDEFRDKCFMRCIVGNYARLLPDVTAIRNTLEDTEDGRIAEQKRLLVGENAISSLNVTCVKYFAQDNVALGIKNLLHDMEDCCGGKKYVKSDLDFSNSLIPVTYIHTAFSAVKQVASNSELAENMGTEAQWDRFFQELSKSEGSLDALFLKYGYEDEYEEDIYEKCAGFEFKNWIFFVFLKQKCKHIQNTYLKYVVSHTNYYEDLLDVEYSGKDLPLFGVKGLE